jgi:hypothetical protein
MARTYTVTELITAVRQRADIENDPHKTDAEIRHWINVAYAELYDMLVQSGVPYFQSETTVTSIAGTSSYALPADFQSVIAVYYNVTTVTRERLHEILPTQLDAVTVTGDRGYYYRLSGSNLILHPTPTASNQTYLVIYIPAPAKFTANETVDGFSGWEEYVVVKAAMSAMVKEANVEMYQLLDNERARLAKRVVDNALSRQIASATGIGPNMQRIVREPDDWWWRT